MSQINGARALLLGSVPVSVVLRFDVPDQTHIPLLAQAITNGVNSSPELQQVSDGRLFVSHGNDAVGLVRWMEDHLPRNGVEKT